MRKLLRLALATGLAIWAWRFFVRGRGPHERASVAYADGSDVVLEPGSPEFDRLASIARTVLPS
ncbi:MAG: hypothetical protein ACRDQT_07845 [Gaiellaceae bacterium]